MPHLAYSGKFNAPIEIAWHELMVKVYHPDRYVAYVTAVEILEDDPANRRVVRKMVTSPGGKSVPLIEEIVWDEATYFIDFKLLEHPFFTGNVTNKIEVHENGDLYFSVKMSWDLKIDAPDPIALDTIEKSVQKTISMIEQSAA